VYDKETLKAANGKEGRPALVACRGKVYDVSKSRLWKDGLHMNRHAAGKDLTADIQAAPHEKDVLIRYPQVGIFKKENADAGSMPFFFSLFLVRFPSLRRQVRPMRPIKMKIWLSAMLMVVSLAVFLWRLYDPAVTTATGAAGRAYFILFLLCLPLVAVIGRYGGQLTFPEEKE